MEDVEAIVRDLTTPVKRAVLMCPFNSRGSGIRGGSLAAWNRGNTHMGNKPALFERDHRRDNSGDYTLTPLGLAVRTYLLSRTKE